MKSRPLPLPALLAEGPSRGTAGPPPYRGRPRKTAPRLSTRGLGASSSSSSVRLLLLVPFLVTHGCGDSGNEQSRGSTGAGATTDTAGITTGSQGAQPGGGASGVTDSSGGSAETGGRSFGGAAGATATTHGSGGGLPATGGMGVGGNTSSGGAAGNSERSGGAGGSGGSGATSGSGGTTSAGGVGGGSAAGSNSGDGGATGGGGGEPEVPAADWPQINGVQWADTDGDPIQAHGGGVLKVGEDYYWFGENRNPDGTFFAVSAYRSKDLRQWEFRNHVLRMTSDPDLEPANVERPKVIYNEMTGQYVMWMHWENGSDYGEARAAVASSDTVDGDYTYHGSFRPFADTSVIDHGKPGYMSRDCTLFVDDDDAGYFISATNENSDLNLYRLTDDYLGIQDLAATLFNGSYREAPALFKRNGVYFLVTSAATGWNPNQAQYATSTSLASGWSSLANVGDGNTFYSQSTYVVEASGGGVTNYLYMGDRWAGAYGRPVNESSYIWLPITFPSDDRMGLAWNNTLDLDATQGKVQASVERFVFVNKKSGLALDIEGGSTANNANIIQAALSGAESQRWSLDYNERGHFRLANGMSGRVLDVPDESTQDGVELVQYDDHDSDNQGWRLVDRGRGEYLIRNQNSQKLVGVVAGSDAEGAAIEQRTETGGDEQVWFATVARD